MKSIRIFVGIFSVMGLVAIRAFENELFYDPFLLYFKEVGVYQGFPSFDTGKLVFHHLFRFVLNALLSLGVIFALFGQEKQLIISGLFSSVFFLLIFPFYLFMLKTELQYGYQLTFYLRRFLIQPVLLLLLIPMFYYLEKRG